jgi:ankyrin repeat protein
MKSPRIVTGMILVALLSTAACRPRTEAPPAAPAAPVAPAPMPPAIADAAFFDAALNGQMSTVATALQRGVDANARDPDGRTALMLAAFNGHNLVVASLLSAGANVDDRDPLDRTALMFASSGPDVATVELLLACKADVNAVDSHERWSPLMFASTEGHLPVLRRQLKNGADPTAKDDDGDTPVSFARKAGHTAVVALLTEAAPTR